MTERFDILCNNCGQTITLQPFQVFARCSNCQTPLKIEETETRIETMIITENEFLTTSQTLIPTNQPPVQNNFELLKAYEKELENLESEWIKKSGVFKIRKSRKYILPRKNQSIVLLIIGILVLCYFMFIDKGEESWEIIGGVIILISSQELYKWWKYSQALKDYEEEKERLKMIIQGLIESII
jgi:hypothetical protein